MKHFQSDLAEDEIATILAALRFYQESSLGERRKQPTWIREIASNGGTFAPLDKNRIQRLCAKLNLTGQFLEAEEESPEHARCEDCGLQADFEEFVPTDGQTHLLCPKCSSSNCFEVDAAK
jgi:Zn finger protein HypA/HybF involved in hydrogenase expression